MIIFFLLFFSSFLSAAPAEKQSKHHPVVPRRKHVEPKRSPHKPKYTEPKVDLTPVEPIVAAPVKEESTTQAEKFTIDRTEAVIYGEEVNEIITRSDLEADFTGQRRTLNDVIFDRLMVQDALRHRILPDEKAIDDYMNKVARSFGGTVEDVHKMFEEAGFTVEEGRRRFSEMYLIRQMQDHKIMSRLFISEGEVKTYYNEHPDIRPASYVLERAFVKSQDETPKHWQLLPEVSEPDLAEDKKFVINFEPGQVSEPLPIEGGFELYRLRTKKDAFLVSMQDRYREIAEILRQPKFEKLMADYRKELFDTASIVYF